MIQNVSEIQVVSEPESRPRTDPRVQRSRAAALTAARELLLEGGWAAVTHATVAERAGVGRSTIYRHWPDPPSLLRDLLVEGITLAHSLPAGRLRDDLLAELSVLRSHLSVTRNLRVIIAIIERAHNDPQFEHLPAQLHLAGSQGLRSILRNAQAHGDLPEGLDLERAVSELVGPLMWQAVVLGKPPDRVFVTGIVDDFLAAQQPGSATPPAGATDPARPEST